MTGNYSLNKGYFTSSYFWLNSFAWDNVFNQKNNSNTFIKPSENGCFNALVGIRNISDYSPFGVLLPERTVESAFYRRGFQGQEHDDEVKGEGNSINFKYRMHDPRVGRFFAVDPLAKKYPDLSLYNFVNNTPIVAVDPDGREIWIVYQSKDANGKPYINQVQYKNGKLYDVNGKEWDESGYGTNYIKAVKKDLDQLKKDHKDAKKMVEEMEASNSYEHYISNRGNIISDEFERDNFDSKGVLARNYKLSKKEGTESDGSWTVYNPWRWTEVYTSEGEPFEGNSDTGTSNNIAVPRSTLAHELYHGYDYQLGTTSDDIINVNGNEIKQSEIDAVNMENKIRKSAGNPARVKYGGIDIPKEKLKD
ncbi:MAG: hypothetical protein EP305_04265 [Bacteroidetes bacterium]|nr:MAG: hypothetical protein EP305_04265 [Bacteroidota bacterium]